MPIITLSNMTFAYGDNTLFDGLDFTLYEGDRLGLIGPNGSGKSTLANLILDHMTTQSKLNGSSVRIGYLEQVTKQTIDGNVPFHKLNLIGIKHTQSLDQKRLTKLSGGERTKYLLTKLLEWHYDLLILDEPTNHLDKNGTNWLIDTLERYHGAILIISHDRYFLDKTVTTIGEIQACKLNLYSGNYTDYEKQKAHERYSHEQAYKHQQQEKARIEEEVNQLKQWSDKGHRESTKKVAITGTAFGSKEYFRSKVKKKNKQIKSKIKRLEKMIETGVTRPDALPEIRFNFIDGDHKSKKVLSVEHVTKYFDTRCLFKDVHFYIARGEKVALLGENGTGKTTLINMIRGIDKDYAGLIHISNGCQVAYISQDILDLDEDQTMMTILDLHTKDRMQHGRHLLACLGLKADKLTRPIGTLSMGERTRVKLAQVILDGVDVLILDEPTNHLDLTTKITLQTALTHYEGTLLLCSHDHYLTTNVCQRTLTIENGQLLDSSSTIKAEQRTDSSSLLKELKITQLLHELSQISETHPKYKELDEAYHKLIN